MKSRFGFPLKSFKKILSTNGLIITLILGIFINFTSDQISRQIESQRYKELLQYEMRTNLLKSGHILDDFETGGVVDIELKLSDDVYKAGLESGLIFDIDSVYLPEILAYYGSTVPSYNQIFESITSKKQPLEQDWVNCVAENLVDPTVECDEEKAKYDAINKELSYILSETWAAFFTAHENNSADFTPTQDRLDSIWLRLLMGNDTVGIQKN